jgi:hypothetical protein
MTPEDLEARLERVIARGREAWFAGMMPFTEEPAAMKEESGIRGRSVKELREVEQGFVRMQERGKEVNQHRMVEDHEKRVRARKEKYVAPRKRPVDAKELREVRGGCRCEVAGAAEPGTIAGLLVRV